MNGEGEMVVDLYIKIKIKDTTNVSEGHYTGIWGPSTYGKTIKEEGKDKILAAIAKALDGLDDKRIYTYEVRGIDF